MATINNAKKTAASNVQNADVQKPDVKNVGAVKPQAMKTAANESRKTRTPVTVVNEFAPFRIGIEGIRTAFANSARANIFYAVVVATTLAGTGSHTARRTVSLITSRQCASAALSISGSPRNAPSVY